MFQDIGQQMLNSSIRQGLQKGLGALGAKLGIGVSKIQRLDGQTEAGALRVRLAAQPGGDVDPTKVAADVIPALKTDPPATPQQSGGIGGSIVGFLGSLPGSLVGAKAGVDRAAARVWLDHLWRCAHRRRSRHSRQGVSGERARHGDPDGRVRHRAQQLAIPQDDRGCGWRQPLLLNRRARDRSGPDGTAHPRRDHQCEQFGGGNLGGHDIRELEA